MCNVARKKRKKKKASSDCRNVKNTQFLDIKNSEIPIFWFKTQDNFLNVLDTPCKKQISNTGVRCTFIGMPWLDPIQIIIRGKLMMTRC